MKTLKIILTAITLLFATQGQSQFWKKLKKRAEAAAEETIKSKVEEKTAKETEKAFDTVFNNKGKLFKVEKTKAAANYNFTHQYTMAIISDKDTINITYYLTNHNEYMGTSINSGSKNKEFITVMDLPNSSIHTFMNLADKKSMTSFKMDLENVANENVDTSNIHIEPTGQTKKILGYQCGEFQVTGPKLSGKVWVTKEADISFQKAFTQLKSKKIKRSKGMDPSWVSMVDGLALEMSMIDYSRKKPKPIKMVCIEIKENIFSIETSHYQKQF